jgi:hypothetical protein
MRKLLLSGIAFAALIAGPATAADLASPVYRRPVVVAAPTISAPVHRSEIFPLMSVQGLSDPKTLHASARIRSAAPS